MYKVIFSKRSVKFISELSDSYREKIKEIVDVLRDNPYGYPYKKIKGETNLYRIRVGKYRLLYEIDRENKTVKIIKIDKRENIYE